MKLREETIKEIDQLPSHQLTKVYDFIQAIKNQQPVPRPRNTHAPYLRSREILKKCSGSLTEDIIRDRQDRI